MPDEASKRTVNKGPTLPRPVIEVITSKKALPAEGGELDAFVRITVDFPPVAVDRKPLNLALVIDRSGSMGGQPLASARQAAQTAVQMLLPGDWVSVVAFESGITVPVPLTKVGEDRRSLLAAIAMIGVGGSTNLYGGWAEGLSQLLACPDSDVVSRVVLLSDGQANQGVTDLPTITADVSQAVMHHVTTSAMGLAAHYDEALLRAVADAGQGNYVFLESPDQLVEAFELELAGLGALRGRNVRLSATGVGVTLVPHSNVPAIGPASRPGESGVRLPDLLAGLPIEMVATLEFLAGATEPGLVMSWDDAVTGTPDEQAAALSLEPVDAAAFAALPVATEVTDRLNALRLATIKLRLGEAARSGDMAGASAHLARAQSLASQMPASPTLTRELRDLEELKSRIAQKDAAMTARYSEKFARDRFTGRQDASMRQMASRESDLRRQKLEASALAAGRWQQGSSQTGSTRAGVTLYSERIDRPGRNPITLEVVIGDITDQAVDAIVNSSNRGLFGSAGVDGAIHRRAGPALKVATQAVAPIDYGAAVFTSGYDLPAQYVIHTATPPWGATGKELHLLAQCYEAALALADRLGAKSVALPAIGTGAYGYPIREATQAAAAAVSAWVTTKGSFETLRFVVFDHVIGQAYLDEISAWR